jgi:sulfite oxidase
MLISYSDLFYVRNHLPVPEVDTVTYSLEITGIGVTTLSLSLHELKTKFPKHTVTAAVQCAGSRRSEMNEVAKLTVLQLQT